MQTTHTTLMRTFPATAPTSTHTHMHTPHAVGTHRHDCRAYTLGDTAISTASAGRLAGWCSRIRFRLRNENGFALPLAADVLGRPHATAWPTQPESVQQFSCQYVGEENRGRGSSSTHTVLHATNCYMFTN